MRDDISTSLGILQANLVSNLKTNNIIIDLLMGVLIMAFVQKCMDNMFRVDIFEKIRKILYIFYPEKKKNEIVLTRKEFISTNSWKGKTYYPKNILAIFNHIHKNSLLKNGTMTFVEHKISTAVSDINYVIQSKESIKISEDIYFKKLYREDGETILENNRGEKTIEHKYSLYSNKKTLNELRLFLNELIEDLNKDLIYDLNKKLIYYIFDKSSDEYLSFDEYPLENDRCFENVFFDEKEDLKDRLDFFLNNREWYKKKGIPYTLGIMFSGKPGCGKTSTIKAIAKYTNRHIIDIPLSKIESCRDLMNIFYKEEINEKVVPMNKRIYLFEDVDSILDVLKERNDEQKKEYSKTETDKVLENTTQLVNSLITKKTSIDKYRENNDKLNLGFFLNLIDGVLETPGRILIISTNYPEKLDKAFIRPGRIDMKIHLEKCSKKMIKEIIEFYYETSIDNENIIQLFYSKNITPAELYQFCFKYKTFDLLIEYVEKEGFENVFSSLIHRIETEDLSFSKRISFSGKIKSKKKRKNSSNDDSMSSSNDDFSVSDE